ncbi:MAG: hexitol phosphatase HxpB [Calditrichaeota bacterium]|nr:hexitol phosphatase HxpB [Calditrichota bacterium]
MIEAVIFDMDGLLIDSEPLWQEAEIKAFRQVNINLSIENCMETTGMRTDEVVDDWYHRRPWKGKSREEITEEIIRRVIVLIREKGHFMPGAKEALSFCEKLDVKMALASSSNYRIIDAVLSKFKLSSQFDVIHSAQEEKFGKPHPGVYISTSNKLGVSPVNCLAIEDSLMGVISAKAARMTCLAVPGTADERFVLADVRLNSLEDLNDGVWKQILSITKNTVE